MKKIQIGSMVTIRFDDGGKETLRIVTSDEANPFHGKVSSDTPFGRAVLGKNEGTEVTYSNSSKKLVNCKILNVV